MTNKKEKDQEEEKAQEIEKMKRAVWIYNTLIDRYPTLYRNLKEEYHGKMRQMR